jgi:hypothetical protein
MLPSSNLQEARDVSWRDPPGSTWFKGTGSQNRMLEHAARHGHKFMAARDYEANDGGIVKMYASYPLCEDFVAKTLHRTEAKHFYELIAGGAPCKLYFDIEWEGPPDPEKASQVVHRLVKKFRSYTHVRIPVICMLCLQKDYQTILEKPLILDSALLDFVARPSRPPRSPGRNNTKQSSPETPCMEIISGSSSTTQI